MAEIAANVGTFFDDEYPWFDRHDHRDAIARGDSRLSEYWEWVVHQIEGESSGNPHALTLQQVVDTGRAAKRFGWAPSQLSRLLDQPSTYANECIIPLANSQEIRCPAHPADCDYVRIVQGGYELAYWASDEWACAPAEVMGALLGAARAAWKNAPQDDEAAGLPCRLPRPGCPA